MNIELSAEYYNNEEKKLFEKYPNYEDIKQILDRKFTIPKDEFLSYMMFTEQADEEGWKTYEDLKIRTQHRLGDIDDYLDFSNNSIKAKKTPDRMKSSGLTERIGVSLGLNVINKFHGLTEADWAITSDTYIDGKRVKDFDYEINMASDGAKFIQVENKGSIVDDNSLKSSTVSRHYSSIKEKKKELLEREIERGISRHQNIYYGTIAVLDQNSKAKVWLVDPDAFQVDWNPRKFKLISRLLYYLNVFKEIGIHKNIIETLYERIERLIESNDIESYNKKPLNIKSRIPLMYIGANNFVNINNSYAFGSFFFIDNKKEGDVFIVALPKAIIKLILSQDFERILKYEFKDADFSNKVSIELSTKLNIAGEEFVFDESKKRYFYQKNQNISSILSGRIFGLINN